MPSCHLCARAWCVASVFGCWFGFFFFSPVVIKQDQPVGKDETSVCSGNRDLLFITA